MDLANWIAFAAIQLSLAVFAAVILWRPPVARARTTGALLIAGGVVLGVMNVAWVVTGGPQGESAVPMRGGTLGFWLSSATALEVVVLGLVTRGIGRRR